MFGRIGVPELILILVVALMIFGPAKLPEVGRSIGRSLREFRKASSELKESISLEGEETSNQQSKTNNKETEKQPNSQEGSQQNKEETKVDEAKE